jgi:hypothetical protein
VCVSACVRVAVSVCVHARVCVSACVRVAVSVCVHARVCVSACVRVRARAEALPVAASGSFRGKLLEDIEKERRKRKKLTLSSFFLGPLPPACTGSTGIVCML